MGVYCDAVYRRDGRAVYTDESFILFVAGLGDFVDRPRRPRSCRSVGVVRSSPVERRCGVIDVPPLRLAREPARGDASDAASLSRFWRGLDEIDSVWLLGPYPLAVLFAVLGIARRKRVVLGVRQGFPAYMRNRHRQPARDRARRARLGGCLARSRPGLPDDRRGHRPGWPLPAGQVVHHRGLRRGRGRAGGRRRSPRSAVRHGAAPAERRRLDPEKNPLLLADAIARPPRIRPRWRLVASGDGTMASDLRAALRDHGVDEHVELLGLVSLAELHKQYRNSHVMLHVSWTEAVPQVLYEVFAAGLPLVATDVGGVAEAAGGARYSFLPATPRLSCPASASWLPTLTCVGHRRPRARGRPEGIPRWGAATDRHVPRREPLMRVTLPARSPAPPRFDRPEGG